MSDNQVAIGDQKGKVTIYEGGVQKCYFPSHDNRIMKLQFVSDWIVSLGFDKKVCYGKPNEPKVTKTLSTPHGTAQINTF